jgi:histidinol-phosphate aminotransferase
MIEVCETVPGHIRAIAPYPPGKPIAELAREMGLAPESIVKLASNENPLGPSPRALEAVRECLPELARYPDGAGFELRAALAKKYGVGMDQVVLGNGSNDVLELAARAFLAPGTSAVFSRHAFAVYPLAVQAVGARAIEVPAKDFGTDPVAMLEAIEEDTRVIFLANPNNPTGTLLMPEALLAFVEAVPRRVLVVLDEAYYEYLEPGLAPPSVTWLSRFPNLMITRTFSKAYGLAGLRVGFALAHPEVADMLNRVRQPFNVSTVAQVAAIAALGDAAHLERSIAVNRAGLAAITGGLARLGLEWIPSFGNFLCFRVGNALGIYQRLLKRGVIVRPVANYGLAEYLRVSVGLPEENERFLTALAGALEEEGKETA